MFTFIKVTNNKLNKFLIQIMCYRRHIYLPKLPSDQILKQQNQSIKKIKLKNTQKTHNSTKQSAARV